MLLLLLLLCPVGGGGGGGGRMTVSVTCGGKCGKECCTLGLGWRDISCWRSADSGSDGISQTAIPQPAASSGSIDRLI